MKIKTTAKEFERLTKELYPDAESSRSRDGHSNFIVLEKGGQAVAQGHSHYWAWRYAYETARHLRARGELVELCAQQSQSGIGTKGFTVEVASYCSRILDVKREIQQWLDNPSEEHDEDEDRQLRKLADGLANLVPGKLRAFYHRHGTLDRLTL